MELSLNASNKIVNRNGWWMPKSDHHFRKVAAKGHYQRHQLFIALACCLGWRVAVDVGAHVGFISSDLLRLFDTVYAFEPHPVNYRCLKKNLPRVNAFPVALGSENKTVSLETPEITNSGAWESSAGDFLDQHRLDNYTFPVMNFLKIDVQGSEMDVLQGAEKTLTRLGPTVQVECYHQGVPNYEVEGFMQDMGYRSLIRIKSDIVFVPRKVDNVDLELL